MQVLRTLFWVLVAVLVVVFANNNWVNVTIALWSGYSLSINLPFLIVASFLLGFLPTFLWYRAMRWRLTSRLATSERELNALRSAHATEEAPIMPPAEEGVALVPAHPTASLPPLPQSKPPAAAPTAKTP